jgi:hypothetical protein
MHSIIQLHVCNMLKIQNVGVFQWSYGIALTISDRGRVDACPIYIS